MAALSVALVAVLGGCASMSWDLGYYWQTVRGHWAMVRAARPVSSYLSDPSLDPTLRERLQRAQQIRHFASAALSLPENDSFTRYADLQRPFVVWNVMAAPRYSLALTQWCFPVAGCVSYRGFFDEAQAQAFAGTLADQGLDVYVAGVPAYSTLGWFADPLLNTFIAYPAPELARLIFHELAHQVAYAPGDSTFNESFATAVEEIGVARWLAGQGEPAAIDAYRAGRARREAFVSLLQSARARLADGYASAPDDEARQRVKDAVFDALQHDYRQLRQSWGGWSGYDRWFAQKLGNAHLGAVATYTDQVPGFRRLAENAVDLPSFYARVREIVKKPKPERDALLAR